MKKGFTLIETLVAVTILALAIAGPMYAASRTLIAAQNSKNQLTASHLAQEGVEYMRRLRDNRYLSNKSNPDQAFADFVGNVSSCTSAAPCKVDVLSGSMTGSHSACGASCPLYINASGQYAIAPSGTASLFTRKVHVVSRPVDFEADVVSRVEWTFKGVTYNVEVIDTLKSWQPAQ